MGKIFKELVKKLGYGIVMSAIAMDGYRRTVNNDNNNQRLETIRAEAEAAKKASDEEARAEYQKNIEEAHEKAKICAVLGRHKEAANEHHSAVEAYSKNPTDYRKDELARAKQKLDTAYD